MDNWIKYQIWRLVYAYSLSLFVPRDYTSQPVSIPSCFSLVFNSQTFKFSSSQSVFSWIFLRDRLLWGLHSNACPNVSFSSHLVM